MESEQIIWNIFNKMRDGNKGNDLTSFIDIAESQDIDITFNLLRVADMKLGVRNGGYSLPEFVSKFINSYLKNNSVDKILDPWVKVGSLIVPLTEKLNPKISIGFIQDKSKIRVINSLQKNLDIKWELDDINNVLDEKSKFDVIISFPPWNLRPETMEFNLDEKKIIINDSSEKLLMLKSLMYLKEEGIGFFILNKGFMSIKKKNNVFSNLKKFGIYIDAALEIPGGSFSHTNSPAYLIIFKKKEPINLFIGELSSETSLNNRLLNNLKSHKKGKIPQLGAIQDLESFKSLNYLINQSEINEIAKISGLLEIPLSDILLSANLGRSNKDFDELSNCVYLPIIGVSDAVTSSDQFKIKPQNYIQLVLDPDKANSEFVAGLYNTKLGKKIRESLESGFIPKLNKTTILKSNFYLSEIETQNEVVNVDYMLKEIYIQLDSYQKQLWKWPKSNKNILKSVELLNVGRRFDYWIQSLPYPLSSILLACKADGEVEHKVNYLLDFFEALSMFNAIVILSSITSNKDFYEKYFLHCINTEDERNNWLFRASFTNWNIVGSCLAKKIRQLMSNDDSKELCFKLFGNPSKEFMNLITSTDIYNILRDVEDYRNLWKGHGARVNKEEYQKRFDILKEHLTKVRTKISFIYDNVSLILPGPMEFDGETHNGLCKEIKGSLPFENREVEVVTDLIKDNLYILHENQYESVKLLPLIRINPGPKTDKNACYFYNRYDLKEDKARFLSYHFEDLADINLFDNNLKSVFSILKPKMNY